MKIHGYCEKCRKIKRVNVTASGLARMSNRGVVVGVCDSCMEEKR